jgi:protein tyrosine phosphatase (PTP) superfamily phosphohydrolase (DUF442 family)
VGEEPTIQLTPEKERDLADALAEAERGVFAWMRAGSRPFWPFCKSSRWPG